MDSGFNGRRRAIARFGAILAAVVVGGGALAALASASGIGGSATINFKATQGNNVVFSGKVSSSSHSCVAGREVVLKRKRPGRDPRLGKDKTSNGGKWSMTFLADQVPKGRYYALVKRKDLGADTCLRVKTGTIHA